MPTIERFRSFRRQKEAVTRLSIFGGYAQTRFSFYFAQGVAVTFTLLISTIWSGWR